MKKNNFYDYLTIFGYIILLIVIVPITLGIFCISIVIGILITPFTMIIDFFKE